MGKRDFDVQVVDKHGKGFHFKGKQGEIEDKTLATRVGIGDVKETIRVDSFKITKIKEKRERGHK